METHILGLGFCKSLEPIPNFGLVGPGEIGELAMELRFTKNREVLICPKLHESWFIPVSDFSQGASVQPSEVDNLPFLHISLSFIFFCNPTVKYSIRGKYT